MGKSLPRVRPGVLARARKHFANALLPANILGFMIDQALKNDDEPITLGELHDLTQEPKEDILTALEQMTQKGLISRPSNEPWSTAGAFRLGQIRIELILANGPDDDEEEDKSGQGKLPLHSPIPYPQLTPEQIRASRGWDRFEANNVIYEAKVFPVSNDSSDGTSHFSLTITANDLGSSDGQREVVKDPEEFSSPMEAFAWWDEWAKTYRLPDGTEGRLTIDPIKNLVDWTDGLLPLVDVDEGGVIFECAFVDEDTFLKLCEAADLSTESIRLSWEFNGGVAGWVGKAEAEDGHRWPGLDVQPAAVEAEPVAIYEWAAGLPIAESNDRLVEAESFELLVKDLYEDAPNCKEMYDDLRRGKIVAGSFVWTRSDAGARWPGLPSLDVPAVEEEPTDKDCLLVEAEEPKAKRGRKKKPTVVEAITEIHAAIADQAEPEPVSTEEMYADPTTAEDEPPF